jgi:hypothetical protein
LVSRNKRLPEWRSSLHKASVEGRKRNERPFRQNLPKRTSKPRRSG